MKPKLIDYPLYRDRRPQEIKQLLIDVASGNMPDRQEDLIKGMFAESNLMIEAAEYIRLLEALLDIYVTHAWPEKYGVAWMKDWKEFAGKQKDLSPEFVKIVEENFWELLA